MIRHEIGVPPRPIHRDLVSIQRAFARLNGGDSADRSGKDSIVG
ncbi:hypothetical protein C7S14_6691 [Burkholderia cepacia]|nr:hypothetical protein [Burkholderia cepacia]QOH35432.1 hypothetical protein C7S14_6691 [Burkholderia cepacia]